MANTIERFIGSWPAGDVKSRPRTLVLSVDGEEQIVLEGEKRLLAQTPDWRFWVRTEANGDLTDIYVGDWRA